MFERIIEDFNPFLPAEIKDNERFRWMGAISYDSGKQLYLVCSIGDEMLVQHVPETELNGIEVDTASERILDMSGTKDVRVGRIALSAGMFRTQDKVKQKGKDFFARLRFSDLKDPQVGTEKAIEFEGECLLRALLGENDMKDGGIAEFTGDGKQKDYALIVNVPNGSKIHTLVGFINPEHGDTYGMDSMTGLFELMKGLNREFALLNNQDINRIYQAVENALKDAERRGLETDTNLRIEIFKARCAAYILLAEIYKENDGYKYLETLYLQIPEMMPGRIDLFGRLSKAMVNRIQEVPLGRVFVEDYKSDQVKTSIKTTETAETKEEIPATVEDHIKSERLKRIYIVAHEQLGDDFYRTDTDTIGQVLVTYFQAIQNELRSTTTSQRYDDIEQILLDLSKTRFSTHWGGWFAKSPEQTLNYRVINGITVRDFEFNMIRLTVAQQCAIMIAYCKQQKIELALGPNN